MVTAEDQGNLYHERTNHHLNGHAESPSFLDWASEPDPFMRREGTPLFRLPLAETDRGADYLDLCERKNNTVQTFSLKNVATFPELSTVLPDLSFQDLYPFAIGGAVENTSLATRPPYHHREDWRHP
jgi:hypothetical protein